MPYVKKDKQTNEILRVSAMESDITPDLVQDDDPALEAYFTKFMTDYGDDTYIGRRKAEYPIVSDALNCILEAFKVLKAGGINLGPEADKWINACESVKTKIPKNWKPK